RPPACRGQRPGRRKHLRQPNPVRPEGGFLALSATPRGRLEALCRARGGPRLSPDGPSHVSGGLLDFRRGDEVVAAAMRRLATGTFSRRLHRGFEAFPDPPTAGRRL